MRNYVIRKCLVLGVDHTAPGGKVLLASLAGSDLRPPSRYRPPAGRGQKPRPPLPPPRFAVPPLPNRLFRSRLAGSFTTCTTSPLALNSATMQLGQSPGARLFPIQALLCSHSVRHPLSMGFGDDGWGFGTFAAFLGEGRSGGNSPSSNGLTKTCPIAGVPASRAALGLQEKVVGRGGASSSGCRRPCKSWRAEPGPSNARWRIDSWSGGTPLTVNSLKVLGAFAKTTPWKRSTI